MKAQISVEFMLMFTLLIAFIYLSVSLLLHQHAAVMEKLDDVDRINKAGAAARALECWLNSGMQMEFDFRDSGISYRIEKDRLMVSHEGNIIEIGGVYSGTDLEAE